MVLHKVQPVDWAAEGESFKEPRIGGRITPYAKIGSPGRALEVYGPHLELFCGASHRMAQMSEIMRHAEGLEPGSRVVIAGDLNTGAHGLGRALPKFARDHLRWKTIGYTEAEWWEAKFWSDKAKNPMGFRDPFHKKRDYTMEVATLGIGLWRAKLDWVLLSREVQVDPSGSGVRMGGMNASDHRYLCVDLKAGEAPLGGAGPLRGAGAAWNGAASHCPQGAPSKLLSTDPACSVQVPNFKIRQESLRHTSCAVPRPLRPGIGRACANGAASLHACKSRSSFDLSRIRPATKAALSSPAEFPSQCPHEQEKPYLADNSEAGP